jgi:hypothetical protein
MGTCTLYAAPVRPKVNNVDPQPFLDDEDIAKEAKPKSEIQDRGNISVTSLTYELEEALASVSTVIHRYVLEGDKVTTKLPDNLPKGLDVTMLVAKSELYSEQECAKYR